jgi:predicted Fe-S protein YdhL (DUF1289 family)
MSDPFPIESNAILKSVGHNGIVNNWHILQKIILRKISFLLDSFGDDLSPASTVRTTSESASVTTSGTAILTQIESFCDPPIGVQRLCEILTLDVCLNCARLVHQISRIIASSHYVKESRITELNLLRRRSSRDSSDSSDRSRRSSPKRPLQRRYSDTMLTRTLKRRRVDF